MPLEGKERHLRALEPWIDHALLFELNAHNDTPAPGSPALALSVYQSYGRIIDFVLSHDAPFDVASGCVDCILMSEPCGSGTSGTLFRESPGPDFTLLCDSACYADAYVELFTMHCGRAG